MRVDEWVCVHYCVRSFGFNDDKLFFNTLSPAPEEQIKTDIDFRRSCFPVIIVPHTRAPRVIYCFPQNRTQIVIVTAQNREKLLIIKVLLAFSSFRPTFRNPAFLRRVCNEERSITVINAKRLSRLMLIYPRVLASTNATLWKRV